MTSVVHSEQQREAHANTFDEFEESSDQDCDL